MNEKDEPEKEQDTTEIARPPYLSQARPAELTTSRKTTSGRTRKPRDLNRRFARSSAFYTVPALFERLAEKVFLRSWQYVGWHKDVASPGQVAPATFLDPLIPEPLLLTCDDGGIVRCLSNVCTHRANLLCSEAGTRQNLTCGYHGRVFGLDGGFLSCPGFEETEGFPSPNENLPEVQLEQFAGLLFAALAASEPFSRWIAPVLLRASLLPLSQMRLVKEQCREYTIKTSWLLYVENYLEGLHVPFVHPSLAKMLDTKAYSTELLPQGVLQIGHSRTPEDAFNLPVETTGKHRPVAAYYFFLFPNLMLNFYPWGLSLNTVRPVSPDETKVTFKTFVYDESRLAGYNPDDIHQTELEDEAIVERVSRGTKSRLYRGGQLSSRWEAGVSHFHGLIDAWLSRP